MMNTISIPLSTQLKVYGQDYPDDQSDYNYSRTLLGLIEYQEDDQTKKKLVRSSNYKSISMIICDAINGNQDLSIGSADLSDNSFSDDSIHNIDDNNLFLKYNKTDNIIYIGNNSKTGLRIIGDDSGENVSVSLVVNNKEIFKTTYNFTLSVRYTGDDYKDQYSTGYFKYYKVNNKLFFGFSTSIPQTEYSSGSTTAIFEYAIGSDITLDGNEICYYTHISSDNSVSFSSYAQSAIQIITDDNNYNSFGFNERANYSNPSSSMAILTPLFIEENRYVSNYLYTAQGISNSLNSNFIFTLNNKSYVHMYNAQNSNSEITHLVVRID